MAEPARQEDEQIYDQPGNVPTRPQLRALEGGGQTSAPAGNLQSVSGSAQGQQPAATQEETAALGQHENQVGRGWLESSKDQKSRNPINKLKSLSPRKKLLGGGAVGAIIALSVMLFTFLSGPLEFIHFAQLLEQFHFSSQSDAQDGRFLKEIRFFKYAQTNDLQKTRLNYFGNKAADYYEGKLNASGIASAYSPIFQNFDGYVIDTTSPDSPYHGMTKEEAQQAINEKFGAKIPLVDGSSLGHNPGLKGEFVISASDLSYPQKIALTYGLLKDAKLNKLSAANATRLLIARDQITLHPVKNLVTKGETAIEAKKAANQAETQDVSQGATSEPIVADDTAVSSDPNATETTKAAAAEAQSSAENAIKTGEQLGSELNSGGGEAAVSSAKSSIFKAGINSGLIYGTACIANTINNNAPKIKEAQVIKPLIRLSMFVVSLGEQIMSGQDIDPNLLNAYGQELNGVDSTGKSTSWVDAQSIQANLGNANTGVKPSPTLQSIGSNAVPFPWITPISSELGVVCSTPVSVIGIGLSFLGGGLSEVATGIAGGALQNLVIQQALTLWVGGHPVDPTPVGADRGSEADYGAVLAANDQALASGGTQLSVGQVAQLNSQENSQAQQQFQSHNIAYKLFDPYDERSAISKLIDTSSSSPIQNIAKMGSTFLNLGHMFGSVFNLFSPKAQAATSAPYDYGVPTYGFSQAELNDPNFENPYANADAVATLLTNNATTTEGTQKVTYVQKASDCFGVNIAPDASGDWGVTTQNNPSLQPYDSGYANFGCGDTTDPNWEKVRFFILDTETAESMGCYAGDDQSCSNIGYGDSVAGSSSTTTPSTGGSLPSGTAQQLAQQLLPYISSGKIFCGSAAGGSGTANCSDIQNTATGQPLGGNCAVSALTPNLLGLILGLVQDDGWTLGISAMCSDHAAEGDGPYAGHSYGSSADFSVQNGLSGTAAASDEKFVDDAATLLATSGGSFGQIQCHPTYAVLAGSQFTTFNDTCNHQHIRAAP